MILTDEQITALWLDHFTLSTYGEPVYERHVHKFARAVLAAVTAQAAPAESAATVDIPIEAGKRIAKSYGYDQVVIVARKVGGREYVTTYGVDKAHCDVAARMGNFFKHKLMGWPEPQAARDGRERIKRWCNTCEGSGKVHQEHQKGCHVGGEYPCPDCDGDGNGWWQARADQPAPDAPQPLQECADSDSPWLVCKTCAKGGKCKQAAPDAASALRELIAAKDAFDAFHASTTAEGNPIGLYDRLQAAWEAARALKDAQ